MGKTRSTQRILRSAILAGSMLFAVSGWGQSTIQARISGGGGNGKCTFEVRVDGVANLQIRGNQGYIQTKSGMPAEWVRLQCNQPLPRYPNNFRFSGVDGRGRQYMLKDPASNNGVAVIRIEDNRNGMEGYTGDIFWSGGNNNGGNWNGGWWNDNWNGGGGWGGNGGGDIHPHRPRVAATASGTTTWFPTARTTFATRSGRRQVGRTFRSTATRAGNRRPPS